MLLLRPTYLSRALGFGAEGGVQSYLPMLEAVRLKTDPPLGREPEPGGEGTAVIRRLFAILARGGLPSAAALFVHSVERGALLLARRRCQHARRVSRGWPRGPRGRR